LQFILNMFIIDRVQKRGRVAIIPKIQTMTRTKPDPTSRRELNKQDKLERIQTAAIELFREKGFDQTTLREIASRAEVGLGTIFLYAADKNELLFVVFNDHIRRCFADGFTIAQPSSSFVDDALQMFSSLFTLFETDLNLSRCFIRALMFYQGEQRAEYYSLTINSFAFLAERIKRAQLEGEIDPSLDATQASRTIFALYQAVLGSWLSSFEPTNPNESLQQNLEMLMHGLRPQKPRRRKT
jgi:AcrR family transcriptional regulator